MSRISERKIILIYRDTRLDELITRHNTREQVRFYLESRGQNYDEYEDEDRRIKQEINALSERLAQLGRVQLLERNFLPNFLFGPDDIPVVVGQDGLVANTLKYLNEQPVVAVNPLPKVFDGKLLPFDVNESVDIVKGVVSNGTISRRTITMAEAKMNDGQSLLAVNDLYIGPKLPVSARYQIDYNGKAENQSSSGIIVSTGLGNSGWMSSVIAGAAGIVGQSIKAVDLSWESRELVFAVREPFLSQTTATNLIYGMVSEKSTLTIASQMPDGGVIFSDGIVDDAIEFNAGGVASISVASRSGQLVV